MLLTVRLASGTGPLAGLYPSHEHSGRTDGAVETAASVLWLDAMADAVGAWLCC